MRSRSSKVIVPVSVRLGAAASSVTAPVPSAALIVGTIIGAGDGHVTCWSTVPPWPSSMVIVKVSVAVSFTARYCMAPLATE